MAEENTLPKTSGSSDNKWANLSAGMIPVVPVSFTGESAMIAWLRLIVYGGATALLWEKHKRFAYITAGCAGLSLATSMSASLSEKLNG